MLKFKNLKKKAASAFRRQQQKVSCDIDTFLQLIQNRNWRKVRRILRSPLGPEICRQSDHSNLNPLGAAFGCNAPYDISKKILNFYPEAILESDDYGSTALHLGCLNAAHPEVIDLILQHDLGREASMMVDSCNHTPMHHTIINTCASIEDDRPSRSERSSSANQSYSVPSAWFHINDDLYIESMITNYFKVIRHFCMVVPEVIFLSTCDGETPLDMVQDKMLHVTNDENMELLEEIYEMLQSSAIKHYRNQKKKWENEGFVTDLPLKEESFGPTDATSPTDTMSLSQDMSDLSPYDDPIFHSKW